MKFKLLALFFLIPLLSLAQSLSLKSVSIYQEKLEDRDASYFTPENFKFSADGKADVSDVLQRAINEVKSKYNFGILFIPEGKYVISKTIYIPQAVRVIGYGKKRPVFVLRAGSPGYQVADEADKGKAKYMFWFTNGIVREGQAFQDASASTFYSALSNVDLVIEDGNPQAVAVRAHFAQHSFVSHVDIHTGKGKAGVFDIGNEMEDVRFFGGEYGIYTTKPSPGWPFVMVDTYFEGQRKAAVKTQEAGLTIVRMTVKNTPIVIDIDSNHYEKLYIEDSHFENISKTAISIGLEGNAATQINLRNINLKNVPLVTSYKKSNNNMAGAGTMYHIESFTYGLQMDKPGDDPVIKATSQMHAVKSFSVFKSDIPRFPEIKNWVNLQTLGAKGDGSSDDTKVIQDAIDKYETIYVPQGWYVLSETITLKPNTKIIGLHPIAAQFILKDNTPAFAGFGSPKAMLEVPKGGTNIVSGIGLNTAVYNHRAVACKWMAGENSYMNDVKFVGGHGTMSHPAPPRDANAPRQGVGQQPSRMLQWMDEAWDSGFWSLWVTDGGGGTFKDIWSANSFSTIGIYISNTSTPGRMYAASVEHHVRTEVMFNTVQNWKIYALQTEEENREGSYAVALDVQNSSNILFANLYMYRVTRVILPYAYGARTWNSKNIEFANLHNFAQTKYPATIPVFDVNSNTEVRPWEFARLHIGNSVAGTSFPTYAHLTVKQLANGFEFANAITRDGKGNVYFAESRLKRIYKWSSKENILTLVADTPWEPLALGFDTNDQLLVLFKSFQRAGTATSVAGGGGYVGFSPLIYSMDPVSDADMKLLEKVPMGSVPAISKAIYPANRGVGFYNENASAVNAPKEAFVATDGVTIIPLVPDLYRASSLQDVWPGKTVYLTDEYNKRTSRYSVAPDGHLLNRTDFAETGEFSTATDSNGNVYITDGEIYVYDKTGKQLRIIKTPERPTALTFGGSDGRTLFFTTKSGFYTVVTE